MDLAFGEAGTQGKRVSWPYSQFKAVISRCLCIWAGDRLINFSLSPLFHTGIQQFC